VSQINLAIAKFEEMKSRLSGLGATFHAYQEISYGLQFQITYSGTTGLVRIYQNKKGVVRLDDSQIKCEVLKAIIKQENDKTKKIEPLSVIQPTHDGSFGIIPSIGTDESGKGDYFGPLVSAGVYVDSSIAQRLLAIGVRDSKKLSDSKNAEIANKILKICGTNCAIIEVLPDKYNALYDQFKAEGKNLNSLLAWGHAKAIEELLGKVTCDTAIADQFADERFILGKLQERGKKIKLIQMPKAESNVAVAAASILARARFLNRLDRLGREFGVVLPKGASDQVVTVARQLIAENSQSLLKQAAKLHFRTTKAVLE